MLQEAGFPAERMSLHALGRRLPVAADDPETSWRLSRRVEVLARGVMVIEPNCPDWSRASNLHPANLPSSNFGCATTLNFVRMLADPRDLLPGGTLGPSDGTREAAAIRRYRNDEVKPLQGSRSANEYSGRCRLEQWQKHYRPVQRLCGRRRIARRCRAGRP
jgi:hypothetical protein